MIETLNYDWDTKLWLRHETMIETLNYDWDTKLWLLRH